MHKADMAMYRAKAAGKDCLVTFASLRNDPAQDDKDLRARFFHDVTKVTTERVSRHLTLFSGHLFNRAHREANVDDTTQLSNRRYSYDRIGREIELAKREGRKLSLAMLDLDDFARFNKDYGELTGDAVLRSFADIASSSIRKIDWIARYGGDEFRLVVPGDLNDAVIVAERIRANVEAAVVSAYDVNTIRITVSIGVTELTSEIGDSSALQQKANAALREAKKQKNCVVSR